MLDTIFCENSLSFPPEENAMNFALVVVEYCNTRKVSSVFPETLVVTTSVLASTVFGSNNP